MSPIDYRSRITNSVPLHLRCALSRYVDFLVGPGYTLRALISGDVREFAICADAETKAAAGAILAWMVEFAPYGSWGTKEAVAKWISGMPRRMETQEVQVTNMADTQDMTKDEQ